MRISDWSSDVCSSDLNAANPNSPKQLMNIVIPVATLISVDVWRSLVYKAETTSSKKRNVNGISGYVSFHVVSIFAIAWCQSVGLAEANLDRKSTRLNSSH